MTQPDRELAQALAEAARSSMLLVASDFDGTIAPIVDDPAAAKPVREAMAALQQLALLEHTHVGIVSGRALRDLASRTEAPPSVHLIGSHGGEFDADFLGILDADQRARRLRLAAELAPIGDAIDGARIEEKPASVAFHYRQVDEARHDDAIRRARAVVEQNPGAEDLQLKRGKCVLEWSVLQCDKGLALDRLRRIVAAASVVFFGDDTTDEDAFAVLSGPDVGIKVGPGTTRAPFRVEDPHEVAVALAQLAEQRERWLHETGGPPIQDLTLLTDGRAHALSDLRGGIVWLSLPRLDSPTFVAEILGGPVAGAFRVEVLSTDGRADRVPSDARYEDDSFTLRTRWSDVELREAFETRGDDHGGAFLREISGAGRVRIRFAPRYDFGRSSTRIEVDDAERASVLHVHAGNASLCLTGPALDWHIVNEGIHQSAWTTVELTPDQPVRLRLEWDGTHETGSEASSPAERFDFDSCARPWRDWLAELELPAAADTLCVRSALVLRALQQPEGSFAAAVTTSLPETLGGVRNWDYRFCWLRDGSLIARTLLRCGAAADAMRFVDWCLRVFEGAESVDRVAPLYALDGSPAGIEAEIQELGGYRGSRPVRVGNGARSQLQLDVFGPIAALLDDLAGAGVGLTDAHFDLARGLAEAVEMRWTEPDSGIWEVRAEPRHYVHSKVMCWWTVDRVHALLARTQRARASDLDALRRLADTIRADVLEHGWTESTASFGAYYGSAAVDASTLWIVLTEMLTATDPRAVATVRAVQRELQRGPTVFRYDMDDGLPGHEGGFHVCTAWLVEALHRIGDDRAARQLFEDWSACAGPTGMLSEEWNVERAEGLGNTPIGYSHLGYLENLFLWSKPAD